MTKKLMLDMDGVLADFCRSPKFQSSDEVVKSPPRMFEEFFFETLPPIDGALWGVRELLKLDYDIHILTQPVKETHYSYSEKDAWIKKWIPELWGKLILTQNKELLSSKDRILVDDNQIKWSDSWVAGGGVFYYFDYSKESKDHNRLMWEKLVHEARKGFVLPFTSNKTRFN